MEDIIERFLSYDGRVSIICARTTNLVQTARDVHDLSPVVTAAFGRLLTISSIMASEMKNKTDKLTIQLKGDGPIGTMLVTANSLAEVKGYVTENVVDIPNVEDGKIDVGAAVGINGYINVVKDIGLKEPYIGICPLVSGEIAQDFAEYFAKSEQRNTAVSLGVLVDKNGIKSAGGYIITPMPDATEEDITKIEQAIFKAGAISKMLDKGMTLEEIAKNISGDDNVKLISNDITPKYFCDCSKDYMKSAMSSLPKEELQEILKEDGKAELTCHFCNKKYEISKEELEELVKAKEEQDSMNKI